MINLIFVRHGQSEWNKKNLFTGETDVDLSPLGCEEAKHAGQLLRPFDVDEAYSSVLRRAIHTLNIMLMEMGKSNIPITKNKALNERNYGDLQGLNKSETEKKYGAEKVKEWRRSYNSAPPNGESLKDTYDRVVLYYKNEIVPKLLLGKSILVSAHGNSLRALMMYLETINTTDIENLDLATGIPKVYELDATLQIQRGYYL